MVRSAVEVTTDDSHSCLSGNIISRRDSDSALINQNSVPPHKDMISELPDIVLLHIMSFMDTNDAVQTCVLSKRWKNLCKRQTSLTFPLSLRHYMKGNEQRIERFNKFASWVLSTRDDSYSVLNLSITDRALPELLDKVIKYALFHDLQHLTVDLSSGFRPKFESFGLIFCCRTLTSLKLYKSVLILPKSLHFPALKSLHLEDVKFTATTGDCAEPFSNCPVLHDLVLGKFSLRKDARVLRISNSTLSSLTLFLRWDYKIVLSTPNLGSCTIGGKVGHELFSECNLSFLREVNINTSWNGNVDGAIIMQWLQVFANVKILTLSVYALLTMLRDLSNSIPTTPQLEPPSFVRLKSLKVRKHIFITDEKVNTLVGCLLQNSPMARVDIIVLK